MITLKHKTLALTAAALAGLLWTAPAVRANSIEVDSVATSLSLGVWDYAYTMRLTAGNSISATNPNGSSLFIFYDLAGLTGPKASVDSGTVPASSWAIFIEATSGLWSNNQSSIVSQGGTAVETDLPTALNVRFQYTGPDFAAGASNSQINIVHLYSTLPPGLYGQFAARWIGDSGNTQVNTQSPITPNDSGGGVGLPTPLPASLWMSLASIVGLAIFGRSRRRAR